jgi:hypothetical protein
MEPTAPGEYAGDDLILEKDVSLLLCRRGVVHQGNACFFSTVLLTVPPRPVKPTASVALFRNQGCPPNLDTFPAAPS